MPDSYLFISLTSLCQKHLHLHRHSPRFPKTLISYLRLNETDFLNLQADVKRNETQIQNLYPQAVQTVKQRTKEEHGWSISEGKSAAFTAKLRCPPAYCQQPLICVPSWAEDLSTLISLHLIRSFTVPPLCCTTRDS